MVAAQQQHLRPKRYKRAVTSKGRTGVLYGREDPVAKHSAQTTLFGCDGAFRAPADEPIAVGGAGFDRSGLNQERVNQADVEWRSLNACTGMAFKIIKSAEFA